MSQASSSENDALKKPMDDDLIQAHLYSQIEGAGITYISIGHRSALDKYHNKILRISKFNSGNSTQRKWQFEPINQNTISQEAKLAI